MLSFISFPPVFLPFSVFCLVFRTNRSFLLSQRVGIISRQTCVPHHSSRCPPSFLKIWVLFPDFYCILSGLFLFFYGLSRCLCLFRLLPILNVIAPIEPPFFLTFVSWVLFNILFFVPSILFLLFCFSFFLAIYHKPCPTRFLWKFSSSSVLFFSLLNPFVFTFVCLIG